MRWKRSLTSFLIEDKDPILHSQYYGYWWPGPRFNIKILSYRYRKSDCGDKTVVRSSYLHNRISYTGKMSSLYWISPLVMPGAKSSVAIAVVPLPWNILVSTLRGLSENRQNTYWLKSINLYQIYFVTIKLTHFCMDRSSAFLINAGFNSETTGIILCMCPTNDRRHQTVTLLYIFYNSIINNILEASQWFGTKEKSYYAAEIKALALLIFENTLIKNRSNCMSDATSARGSNCIDSQRGNCIDTVLL